MLTPIDTLIDTVSTYLLSALMIGPLFAMIGIIATDYTRKALCRLTKPRPSFLTDDERRDRIRAHLHGAPLVGVGRGRDGPVRRGFDGR